jgi:tetratricopeptide (TPR) repeat protein
MMRSISRPTPRLRSIMPPKTPSNRTSSNRWPLIVLSLMVLSLSACGGAQARKAKHMEKGQTYLAAGNLEKARVEFQNALQIAPTDAEARYENGIVSEKLGKMRDAAQFYQGAIDVDPQHLGARTNLARLFLISGAPDRALDLIGPAFAKHPDDAELLAVRAAARLQQKNVSGAQEDAERAVQLQPTNPDAVAVLAGLYNNSGEKDKARTLIEQSIKLIPQNVDLRLILAQIYAGENNKAATEALLIDLVRLKPAEKAHRIRLAQFYAGTNQVDAAEHTLRQAIKDLPAEDDLKLALVQFLAQRRGPEVAEQELKAMIAADAKDNELKFALANFYETNRHPEKAEVIYQGVVDSEHLDAAGLSARDRLAALRAQRNDVPGALKLIDEVLAKSPRDDDALFLRGNISLAKKDPRVAIADLRAVLRDQPNAVGVLRALARAHVANGEPAIAEETLRSAVEANPKDAALRLEFAQLLAEIGKADQAKPMLAELIKAHPDNAEALDAAYRVSMATKDFATAKTDAEALVAIRPKSATAYLYEGRVAEAQNRTDDAIRFFAAAVGAQPDAYEPLQEEMHLLVAAKRIDEAMKRLDDFSARYPSNPLGLDAKGEILLRNGKVAEASDAFNLAIARTPKFWISYRDLAAEQLAANDPDTAVETLRKAKSIVDQPDLVSFELAEVYQRINKLDAAIAEYEEILHHTPQADVAANNLAMLLANFKKDPASLDRAKALTARFAESQDPSFLDTYGWVLYKRGETAASVPILERVVAKAANDPVAHYHLGMAQSQLGSSAAARDNLTLAVNSGRKFSGLDEAKATLDKLGKAPVPLAASPKT